MNARTLTIFMSHGTNYLSDNQRNYEKLSKIYAHQLTEALNSLRMRESKSAIRKLEETGN